MATLHDLPVNPEREPTNAELAAKVASLEALVQAYAAGTAGLVASGIAQGIAAVSSPSPRSMAYTRSELSRSTERSLHLIRGESA